MYESVCDLFIGMYVCVRMMSLCVVSLWVGVRAYQHVCICISTCTCMRICVCARVLRLVKVQCFLFCRLVLLWGSQRWEQTEKRAKKNIEMERKRRKKEAKPNSLQVTELQQVSQPGSQHRSRTQRRHMLECQCPMRARRGTRRQRPREVRELGGDQHRPTWAPEVRASARVSPPCPRRSRSRRVRDVKCRPRGCSGQGMGWAINNHTGYTTPWTVTSPSQEKINNI